MSHHLYAVRVEYYAGSGIVKVPGVLRRYTSAPVIPGLPLMEGIDYAPGIEGGADVCRDIRPVNEARREMNADEMRCLRAWLKAVELGAA